MKDLHVLYACKNHVASCLIDSYFNILNAFCVFCECVWYVHCSLCRWISWFAEQTDTVLVALSEAAVCILSSSQCHMCAQPSLNMADRFDTWVWGVCGILFYVEDWGMAGRNVISFLEEVFIFLKFQFTKTRHKIMTQLYLKHRLL